MSNPALLVASLTNSLAYTDRAGAGAFTGVDPIRYDSGLWVEAGTSNYARNQVAKNNTVQWGVETTATWTRETTLPGALPGWLASMVTTCFKFTATANIVGGSSLVYTTNDAVPSAGTYIPAAYVWVPSSYGTALLTIAGTAYTGGTTTAGSVDLGLRDQWQLVKGEQVVVGGDLAGAFLMTSPSGTIATGEFFYLTLAMFQPSPLTSPSVGSFGAGWSFSSTAEQSTSTRAASSASIATASHLLPGSGSLAFRFRRLIDTGSLEPLLEVGENTAGHDHLQIFIDNDTLWVAWDSNGALPQTIDTGVTMTVDQEFFVYTYWDGAIFGVSIDNGTPMVAQRDVITGDWGSGPITLKAE